MFQRHTASKHKSLYLKVCFTQIRKSIFYHLPLAVSSQADSFGSFLPRCLLLRFLPPGQYYGGEQYFVCGAHSFDLLHLNLPTEGHPGCIVACCITEMSPVKDLCCMSYPFPACNWKLNISSRNTLPDTFESRQILLCAIFVVSMVEKSSNETCSQWDLWNVCGGKESVPLICANL